MKKKSKAEGRVHRRPRALGVHSINGFAFAAPSLDEARKFHKAFGLDVRDEKGRLGLYTGGYTQRWGAIVEGSKKKVHHLSFGLFEEDLAAFAKRLQKLGVARIDAPRGFESNGLWFRDHDGTPVEVVVSEKTSPNSKPKPKYIQPKPGRGAAPKRSLSGYVHPERLSHVLCFSSDVQKAIDFYSHALGLRLSDRSGNDIAFMHAPHGSDHHIVAFCRSSGPGIHHSSWAVDSIHEIGLGASRMAEQGYEKGWGLGRHVLGSNYFHYVRDPWGSYAEYSYDIDYVASDVTWKTGDYGPEDSFYVWGPNPPSDFVVNHELA